MSTKNLYTLIKQEGEQYSNFELFDSQLSEIEIENSKLGYNLYDYVEHLNVEASQDVIDNLEHYRWDNINNVIIRDFAYSVTVKTEQMLSLYEAAQSAHFTYGDIEFDWRLNGEPYTTDFYNQYMISQFTGFGYVSFQEATTGLKYYGQIPESLFKRVFTIIDPVSKSNWYLKGSVYPALINSCATQEDLDNININFTNNTTINLQSIISSIISDTSVTQSEKDYLISHDGTLFATPPVS